MINVFHFDLSSAKTNYFVHISGEYIGIISATNFSDTITVNFDSVTNAPIILKLGEPMEMSFKRLYLSWDVQGTDTIELLVATKKEEFVFYPGNVSSVYKG